MMDGELIDWVSLVVEIEKSCCSDVLLTDYYPERISIGKVSSTSLKSRSSVAHVKYGASVADKV